MKEHEKIILEKIKTYAEQAIQFKEDMVFEEFSYDLEFLKINNHIPWRKIRGMRNRIVHDYEGIQLNIVWDVLIDFLPELIKNINELLDIKEIGEKRL